MIAEAVDTVLTLGWALLVWIVLLAATASLALWTILVTAAWACRTAWRGVVAAVAAVQASRMDGEQPDAPEAPRAAPRPSWAQPDKEAA